MPFHSFYRRPSPQPMNIADQHADVLDELTPAQRRAITQLMSDAYYAEDRLLNRSEIIELVQTLPCASGRRQLKPLRTLSDRTASIADDVRAQWWPSGPPVEG